MEAPPHQNFYWTFRIRLRIRMTTSSTDATDGHRGRTWSTTRSEDVLRVSGTSVKASENAELKVIKLKRKTKLCFEPNITQ